MSKKIKNGEQPITPNSLFLCDDGEKIIANDYYSIHTRQMRTIR